MEEDAETPAGEGGAGERFGVFVKRNIVLAAVFFLSNLITAVSTLVTAVAVLRETQTDWRAVEYRKLRELRAGYTLEKFQKELGPPAFRTPLATGGPFVRNVYRPREEYWVEVISNKSNAAVTYAVTSCDPAFRPEFRFGGEPGLKVVLNRNVLSDVLSAEVQRDEALKIFLGSTASAPSLVFQVYGGAAPSGYRQAAWGLNDVCPEWRSTSPGHDPLKSWQNWFWGAREAEDPPAHTYIAERLDTKARAIAAESIVNTYAETAFGEDMLTYYPRQIGVDRLVVR
ncbi:ETEC_3214 domain-containing protein [Streptomyces sp. NPDC012769]|uniref:ETEC_3214 domain-containing protein n=1 Tax=Streptomyces sp. NPDC012769 TaxID=3364848 RepID=UPI00367D2F5E